MSETKWTKGDWVPRGGLMAWHSVDISTNGQTINDASGNNRTLDTGFGSTPPDYVPNTINGLPAIHFDGTTHDPPKWAGSLNPRHVFIVAGHDDAGFGANYRGLLSGVSTGDILTGAPSTTNFFNFSVGQSYRRFDVAYAESAALAIFGSIGVVEVSLATAWPLNGIQVGMQRTFTDRRWKGNWCEQLIYDRVLTDIERWKIYRYIACKYLIWPQAAAGSAKAVFPFPADRTYGREHSRETYLSEPYSGDPSALVRGNFGSAYDLAFTLRRQEELDAAKAFYEQHQPLGEFVFRDYRFNPYRDSNVRFGPSSFLERGSDVTYRFNYSFNIQPAD